MIVKCAKCDEVLEIPDAACENGRHFECFRCSTQQFYFNGRLYPLKESSSFTSVKKRSRPNLPKNRYLSRIISGLHRQTVGRIWLCVSSIVVAIGLMVLVSCLIADPKKNIPYKAEPKKQDAMKDAPYKAEANKQDSEKDISYVLMDDAIEKMAYAVKIGAKYGTNSVESLKADLVAKQAMLKMNQYYSLVHKFFKERMYNAGYCVASLNYSGNNLTSLYLVNYRINREGEMRPGLAAGSFTYPLWLSEADAKMIWGHYSDRLLGKSESIQSETEAAIEDLERRLSEIE